MTTIWIIPIEPLESRYSKQWYTEIPDILNGAISDRNMDWNVITIKGHDVLEQTTKGAFLDFGFTNIYKGSQAINIANLFSSGDIRSGDKFFVTDAWNFNVTVIKYMSDLLEIPVEIHAIWHAGAYDPTDILGLKMGKEWSAAQERAWFYACDYNYYASEFHKQMFLRNLDIPSEYHYKAVRSSLPSRMYLRTCLPFFENNERDNTIVFAHRLNEDKQPEIFRDLVKYLPRDWNCILTQEEGLSKEGYYDVLSKAKIAFSCSLHENYGIGQIEGALCGCIPMVPDRASYSEIYVDDFKYPSEWTSNWDNYIAHRDDLIRLVIKMMNHYDEIHYTILAEQIKKIEADYIHPTPLIERILGEQGK